MALTLLTPAEAWPVTLTEAKAHCRVTHSDEDTLITGLIKAATRHVEQNLSMSIAEQQWLLTLDEFADNIELLRGPVIEVDSVEYIDEAGDTQTADAELYFTDLMSRPAWIVLNTGQVWPATMAGVNMVSITYTAGMTAVPDDLKHAILLLIGHWYQNREAAVVATISSTLELAVDSLLQPYRWVLV